MAEYVEILGGVLAVALLLYYYLTSTYNFWKAQGIPGPKPVPLFGNATRLVSRSISVGCYSKEIYEKYKDEPVVGIYLFRSPILVLNDPELIKAVLIKDFSKFTDRGFYIDEKTQPIAQTLFSLENRRWRPMRSKLTPIFTTGRLKEMFISILKRAEDLENHLNVLSRSEKPIDIRDVTAKFTTDVIGDCAFGVDAMALAHDNSEFREMGRHLFQPQSRLQRRFILQQILPVLGNLYAYFYPDEGVEQFFSSLFTKTVKCREENKIVKQDFVNALMQIRDQNVKENLGLTEAVIAAQAFLFFTAGFETSSSTMSNALYELALHQDIQDKLRQEINEAFQKNGTDLNYENIRKLTYLDYVFRETLRKYPPLQLLQREVSCDYTFEDMKVTIPAGMHVWIPVHGIHYNPSIYPNPEKFDPDRFKDSEVEKRHPMNYLPFGDGPRNCIGARFAVYQVKVGLIKVLHRFKFDVCEKTEMPPYELDPETVLLTPKNDIYLKMTKIK